MITASSSSNRGPCISQRGEVSASFTAFYDLLITNRLILQPRVDLKLQAQPVPDLDSGSGLTDFELGARLRYGFTRNLHLMLASTGTARSVRLRP